MTGKPIAPFVAHARVPPELPVAFIFFASGAAALIFEVVWFHRAGLVFGNDLWSTSIVLSTFMGGLALGNALVVASGHRIRRFLRTYAALEAIVAITGVAVTHLLPQLTQLLVPILRHLSNHQWLVNGARSVFAFAVLTVPTTAMGATLPILVAALYPRERGFGRVLGRLYGWNTLGAVAGVLSAELVLIPDLGVAGSAWFAGLVNVTGAIAALVISRRVGGSRAIPSDNTLLESPRAAHRRRRLLACAFMAGAGLMALEVIWFRFLSMFVLNSTLTVSLMLAVVLAAIGMGGLTAATWLQCRPHATSYLPAAAFSTATAASGSYVMFQFLATSPSAAQWYRILWFACSLTFAASLLSGVIFTFIGAALRSDQPLDTRAAGWLTLANTMGAMCGSLAATFVLLPTLGMEHAIFALAILYCAIGVLAMLSPPKWRSAADRAAGIAALATLAVLIRFPFGLMADKYFGRVAATYGSDGSRIVATREGPSETIFLMEQRWLGRPIYDRLVTNGFSMSGTHLANKRYMRFFVYWPMLLHNGPLRHVLVVCHGVGVTLKAVTDLDSVDSIDVVEISPDVIAMNDIIYPPSEQPLRDRRVQLHIEDGRQFLQLTDQRFDLITGEPPPPLTPGAVNLYTREYFQLIYDRLAEGGISTYWLPVGGGAAHGVTPIIRAFCDVFEDCSLWNGTLFDWILIGTRHAQGPASEDMFTRAWSHPVVGQRLREVLFETPQQFGATFMGDATYLNELTASTDALTDNYPRRVFRGSPNSLFADSKDPAAVNAFVAALDSNRARLTFEQSPFIRRFWPESLIKQTLTFFDQRGLIDGVMVARSNPLRYIAQLDELLTNTTLRRLPLWILGSNDALQQVADTGNDGSGMVEYELGVRLLTARSYAAAANYLAAAERLGLAAARVRPLRVYALCLAGQLDAARQLTLQLEPAADADARHFWAWMESRFGIGPTKPSGTTEH